MTKPGDVVELKAGLFGLEPPRNLAILLSRRRVKGVAWVRVLTLEGAKEAKAENLGKRAFQERYAGPLDDEPEMLARLKFLVSQNAGGKLREEAESDLERLELALWHATCRDPRPVWTEEEIAAAHFGPTASPQNLRDVRLALEPDRRPGVGSFQTVGGRGDRWRPWSEEEARRMKEAWQDLNDLRRRMVATETTPEESGAEVRRFAGRPLSEVGLGPRGQTTLGWVRDAMQQYVEWDGVPDGPPVQGIGGLGAVLCFGMDLHRQLGFLAQDWSGQERTTRSSDYVHFLLGIGLWTPQQAVDALVRRHVNQEEFFEHTEDPKAEAAAAAFGDPVPEEGRTDLRHLPCYTIDPPDAKDFDDAVGIEDLGGGAARLWVHVADVSHYVVPDTYLDRHAKTRATSVYLPGRVLPMLPHRLSDHLCSLRSDGDRYALSVGMDVDREGRIGAQQFHKALIRVTENLHYGQALERAKAGQKPFADLMDLAARMRRHRRGIELETGELKVLLGSAGFSALEKRADDATRMIETFMVAANEAVAAHLAAEKVPLLFRCHPLPERGKLERLRHQLATMGVEVEMDLPGPKPGAAAEAESLLDRLRKGGGLSLFGGAVEAPKTQGKEEAGGAGGGASGEPTCSHGLTQEPATPGFASLPPQEQEAWLRPLRAVTQALAHMPDAEAAEVGTLKVLGAMGRAFYSPDNAGHFGLASTHYCHFTSPIRRYPDLVVHRNLKWLLAGKPGAAPHPKEKLGTMSDHCSNQERAADALERRIKASCLVLASAQEAAGASQARITGMTPASLFVVRGDGIEARIPSRDLPGGPYLVDEWESMLFRPAEPGETADWVDPETGEARRVRARLAGRAKVALAGRDVASGRTGARLVEWG